MECIHNPIWTLINHRIIKNRYIVIAPEYYQVLTTTAYALIYYKNGIDLLLAPTGMDSKATAAEKCQKFINTATPEQYPNILTSKM